ncbi:MAG TPA: ferrochelatase, partial [Vicinamibacteria bacterium]
MSAPDALLIVSFGGPEGPDEVLPFLDNVLRGKPVSDERKREVAGHYLHFGGRSPIGDQCRALVAALEGELGAKGPRLPVYWGNRNWHPMLADTLQRMADDGVKRALAFMTSAYSSYSGCRQYRENVAAARAAVGERAPEVDKLRVFYNHPGFVEPMARNVRAALARIPEDRRARAALAYTAHSIPRG